MLKNFFTYKGRIGPKTYAISLILVLCAVCFLASVLLWILHTPSTVIFNNYKLTIPYKAPAQIVFCLFAIIISFPIVKRLHDIKASGYFFLLFPVITLLNLVFSDANGQIRFESLETMKYVLKGLSWFLFVFILIAFKKGTQGPNKYGPDPLQTPQTSNV